jgi:hypothetical protein
MELTPSEVLGAYQLGLISMPEARKHLGFSEVATEEGDK